MEPREFINIAVEGCCHGELDKIYTEIAQTELATGTKVDLLLICGDFECVRDYADLCCMAVPEKYRHIKSFKSYFTGEKIAPIKTIFIGGNHEASNVLQSLYYGGYVAPNIYFLGFGGVVNYRGIRIAGLSGIYDAKHYTHGIFIHFLIILFIII
jgi:lariat debranching enzyme